MSKTYPMVNIGYYDAGIRSAISSVECDNAQSGTNSQSDMQTGMKTVVPYATYEPNYWFLDGNSHFVGTFCMWVI